MQEITKTNSRIWSRLGQRGTICGVALREMLAASKDCYVITADLAHLSGLDRIKADYPRQFINAGIAEQNMIGVAAGLALEGNTVFATTYATFITMRCYEQIRHNLGYQGANVKLIGSTSGLAMGMSGNTHYSYEDIAIMRAIPGMTVVSPSDAAEAYLAAYKAAEYDGPVYIRLSGNLNEPILHETPYGFDFGKAECIQDGSDVVIVATGGSVAEAVKAGKLLEADGVSAAVINMHTIKPLDTKTIDHYLNMDLIVTVEEHNVIGGLGGAVAEHMSSVGSGTRLLRIGIEDAFVHPAEYGYLKEKYGLSAKPIYERIKNALKGT